MLTTQQLEQFKIAFPQFNNDPILLKKIQSHCQYATIPAGTVICEDGQSNTDLPLLISGLVRVYKMSASGKEITLYHIGEDESCVLSASTILGGKEFPATAKTVSESHIVILSETFVRDWVVQSTPWQQFIFSLVSQRLSDVITVVEEVAFQRMDRRIAIFLCKKQLRDGNILSITHQHIADEVGTAREVVTRVLRDLELRKIVELSRGQINIINLQHLDKISVQ